MAVPMEKITLTRTECTDEYTFGEISYKGVFVCFTLEDPIRDTKIKHKTAIPYGTYKVILAYSQRFKILTPRLIDVPNFTAILIHKGNTTEDTSGCILVGRSKYENRLIYSAIAFDKLLSLIRKILDKNSLVIEIVKPEVIPEPITVPEPIVVSIQEKPTEQIIQSSTQLNNSTWKNSFPYLLKQILILLKMLLSHK